MVTASAAISIVPLAFAAHKTPKNCSAATATNSRCGIIRSIRRPTVSWPMAPHRKTAVARPPTASSGTLTEPLVDDLRQLNEDGVEDEAAGHGDDNVEAEHGDRGA